MRLIALLRRLGLAAALAAGAAFGAAPASVPKAAGQEATAPKRIAVLDWTIAETMAGMGLFPAAVAEKSSYEVWSQYPALPASTLDLGMRAQPNLERMIRLAPDLILASQDYAFVKGLLDNIAPTTLLDVYTPGQDIYRNLSQLALALGKLTGQPALAQRYVDTIADDLQQIHGSLAAHRDAPVAVIQFIDDRNVRIYGRPSIFASALERIGVRNAWQASVNQWGFQSVGLAQLAALPPGTTLFIIKPYPANLPRKLHDNAIWNALPSVRQDRIVLSDPIWTLGSLSTLLRFAKTVQAGLLAQDRAKAGAHFRFPDYQP